MSEKRTIGEIWGDERWGRVRTWKPKPKQEELTLELGLSHVSVDGRCFVWNWGRKLWVEAN